MTKILIDTDPGQDIDDLLALWFALSRPEFDILGITTVTWPSPERARLVRRLLRYLGRSDIPVAAGAEKPLRPVGAEELARLRNRAAAMNHAAFCEPHDPRDDISSDESAAPMIVRLAKAHPGELVLTCIAPLTNLAAAMELEPKLPSLLRAVHLMGGETHLNQLEHNIAWDYTASRRVFDSGVPIMMGTWDVTRRFMLSAEECDAIRRAGELGAALGRAIDLWQPAQSWKPRPVMYDVFPFVSLIDPSIYRTEPKRIAIETAGEFTTGMTVCVPGAPNAQVTTEVRLEPLRELYLSSVLASCP